MRCLNLKVTYDCPNKCGFCFSKYMKDTKIPIDDLTKAVKTGRENASDELVLSGGEPTLYPEYIIKLINLAKELGYKKYIIQTNGYGISKYDELTAFLSDASNSAEICVSFSVHSHKKEIHDKICKNEGAFENLMDAMEKISNTNCSIYTNTVINSLNINRLYDIADMIMQFSPRIMQFAIMHLKEENELSIPFLTAVKAARALGEIIDHKILKTEGIPYCLFYGMEECVGESAWPNVLDLYNKSGGLIRDFKQLDSGMRKKGVECGECIMDKICMGVWKETFDEFCALRPRPIK